MILLDTHVVIWSRLESNRLSKPARTVIHQARLEGEVAIASITIWELANAVARGRIQTSGTVESAVESMIQGVEIVELTTHIAAIAAQLGAAFPGDPADRIIAATAVAGGMPLVTKDERIKSSGAVQTIW